MIEHQRHHFHRSLGDSTITNDREYGSTEPFFMRREIWVKPGLPPWGPHVRFRRVQTLVAAGGLLRHRARSREPLIYKPIIS
jgi:hypothetical protein